MSNLAKIREALQRNNIILEDGELRVDEPNAGRPLRTRRVAQGLLASDKARASAPPDDAMVEDAPASVRIKPTTWAAGEAWYLQERFAKRLDAECAAVLAQVPSARLAVTEDDDLFWEMSVRSLGGQNYVVSVVYPPNFPFAELKAYVLQPPISSSPHQFSDGQLCLGHAFGAATSAVTTAAWVAAWLSAHEVYCQTRVWPEFINA